MRLIGFDRLDRYLLRQFLGPLAVALGVLLTALLLQRLLRLFDLAAAAGARLVTVFEMALNLVPYYLGLSLPMAFMAAIFLSVARLGDDHEIDVMLASGRSITRIATPFFALAGLLAAFNLLLLGELQPLARYAYHVEAYRVAQTSWNAKISPYVFIDSGQGFVFSADTAEPDGRHVGRLFMERRVDDAEEVTTAERGFFHPSADGNGALVLDLENAVVLREVEKPFGDDSGVQTLRFSTGRADHDFAPDPAPFRARGEGASEMTFGELRAKAGTGDAPAAAEFHSRLARALTLPLLPLIALPLGIASRGGRRAPGIVFAAIALLVLNHALGFGTSLASRGHVHAATAVWAPYGLFALVSLWVFRGSLAWPGDNPVSRAVIAIERAFEGARPRTRRKARDAAGAAA